MPDRICVSILVFKNINYRIYKMPYNAEQRKKRYLKKRDELIAYQLQYYRENKEKCQQTNTEWYRKFREEHGDEYRERQRAYYRKAHPKRATPIRFSKPPKPPKHPKLTKAEKKEIRDAPIVVPTTGLTLALVSRNKEVKPKFIYADAPFSMTLE
jgi:hypothetical protein